MDFDIDSQSYMELHLTDGITYEGQITASEADTEYDTAYVVIDEGCTWILTGDCTISEIENYGVIVFNGYTITLADGTVLAEEELQET